MSVAPRPSQRASSLRLLVFFGLISLLGDFKFEGFRSVLPLLVGGLGGGTLALGLVWGLGELLSYSLRVPAGLLADRLGAHWALVMTGYALTAVALPSNALATSIGVVAALYSVDRVGKALRTPPRDAMLSKLRGLGAGKIFGIHKALDQTGGVLGPLVASLVIATTGDPRLFLATLVVPACAQFVLLALARREWNRAELDGGVERAGERRASLSELRPLLPLMFSLSMFGLGLFQIPFIISEEEGEKQPLLYAAAQLVYVCLAPAWGIIIDKWGARSLTVMYAVGALAAILGALSPLAAASAWGAAWSLHEVGYRAILSRGVPADRRASALGLYSALLGGAILAGSAAIGALLEVDPLWARLYCVISQTMGALAFSRYARTSSSRTK